MFVDLWQNVPERPLSQGAREIPPETKGKDPSNKNAKDRNNGFANTVLDPYTDTGL